MGDNESGTGGNSGKQTTRGPQDTPAQDQAQDQEGWGAVNEAWERVFKAVAEVGTEIAGAYREAYAESTAQSSEGAEPVVPHPHEPRDRVSDITSTVETSLGAARSAFERSVQTLASSDRTHELSRDFEDALRVSLGQLGATFTELSEQIGTRGETTEREGPAADTEGSGGPDNVIPGPGQRRD